VVIPDWNNNGNKFDVHTCGGYEELFKQDKHFFVKSVEAEESSFKRSSAQNKLKQVLSNQLSLVGAFRSKAILLNEGMNAYCGQFEMFGSIRSDDGDTAIYGNYLSVITNVREKTPIFGVTLFMSTYRSFIML